MHFWLVRGITLSVVVVLLGLASSAVLGEERGLRLEGLDGGELRESELETGDSIVVFWASWSPRCRDIEQRVEGISQRWKEKARVLTVNFQEEPDEIHKFIGAPTAQFSIFLDSSGSFAKKHSITTLPSLLIYRDGRQVHRGLLPADVDAVLRQWLPSR
ncbi:MAG: TlpA family protein disulfide reductase [Deltaproteobacteria bacterium]|nr:TlpA family protein disulfide reductase [Deltaproteobacteria bacterium]